MTVNYRKDGGYWRCCGCGAVLEIGKGASVGELRVYAHRADDCLPILHGRLAVLERAALSVGEGDKP
jgi:hypothetical protein